jgi:hypothetical protein
MTEAEWLVSKSIPTFYACPILRRSLTQRKARLFLVACCRLIWHIMTDNRCRKAVEVAELFADGHATPEELAAARTAVRCRDARSAATLGSMARRVAEESADVHACWVARRVAVRHAGQEADEKALAATEAQQAGLLRDVLGNPFRPLALDPLWVSWGDYTVLKFAAEVYDEGAFDRLPILGDALEDAGCDDRAILDHCRGPGPHVRGCWLVDLILDRS